MRKRYILVVDSGIGGISVLKKLKDVFINESFIYLADNSISPYGDKTKKFLKQHILKLINEYMKKYSIKLIIFACNTLTATTINYVRNNIPIKIVGTEPPIKCVKNNNKTLVLATNGTIKYSKLLKRYKNNKQFTFVPLKNIATILDNNFTNREEIIKSLKKQIPKNNYKNVVLGCTHYYFIKKEINKVLYHKVKYYDAIKGIIKQVKRILSKTKTKNQTIKIHTSKNNKKLKMLLKYVLLN